MNQDLSVWLTFIIGGVLTFLQRASFIIFAANRSLPKSVQRALQYVAPAAFAAIVAPRFIQTTSLSEFTAPDARLIAAVLGGVLMWKIPKMPVLLAVGMTAFWLLRWIGF